MPFGHSKTTWGSKKVNNFCPPQKLFTFWFLGATKTSTKKPKMVPKNKEGNSQNPIFVKEILKKTISQQKISYPPSPPNFLKKKFSNFLKFSQNFSNFLKFFLRIFLKIALSAARSVFENFSQKYFLKFFGGNFPAKFSKFGVLSCFVFENSSPKLSKMKMWQLCPHQCPNNLKVPESSFLGSKPPQNSHNWFPPTSPKENISSIFFL